MEIQEKITRFLSRKKGTIRLESQEKLNSFEQGNIIDILSGKYKWHWTEIKGLNVILEEGLVSSEVAERIGKKDYRRRSHSVWNGVYFRNRVQFVSSPEVVFGDLQDNDLGRVVGIVVEKRIGEEVLGAESETERIDPQRFKGFVLVTKVPSSVYSSFPFDGEKISDVFSDSERARKKIDENVGRVCAVVKGTGLCVYSLSGKVLWPGRMLHEEIVQILKEKEGQNGSQ